MNKDYQCNVFLQKYFSFTHKNNRYSLKASNVGEDYSYLKNKFGLFG